MDITYKHIGLYISFVTIRPYKLQIFLVLFLKIKTRAKEKNRNKCATYLQISNSHGFTEYSAPIDLGKYTGYTYSYHRRSLFLGSVEQC